MGSRVSGCHIPSILEPKRAIEIVQPFVNNPIDLIFTSNLESFFIFCPFRALDAGPVVLILTALTLIFTIGLSDDENRGGLSAYSVFNRGFEQLMGSVDADSLLAQHVGGGMMMNMNNHNHAADERPERDNVAPPRRPRHQVEDNHDALANEDEGNDAHEQHNDNDQNNNNNNNRARKSGKKARRRNLDQRREIRRQREAATQIGLEDGQDDAVAVQRIIEEQIAAENNQQ